MKLKLYLSIQNNNIDDNNLNQSINEYAQIILLNLTTYIGRNHVSSIIYSNDHRFEYILIEKFNNVLYNNIHCNLMEMELDYNKIKASNGSLDVKFYTEEIK